MANRFPLPGITPRLKALALRILGAALDGGVTGQRYEIPAEEWIACEREMRDFLSPWPGRHLIVDGGFMLVGVWVHPATIATHHEYTALDTNPHHPVEINPAARSASVSAV